MPGAISQAGFADEILPLDRIPEAITRHKAQRTAKVRQAARSRPVRRTIQERIGPLRLV